MAMNGPSYRFRLERVRALRERREEQAKQEFGVALQARERCQEEVTRVAARIDAACRDQLVATADDLGAHQSYLERLERAHEVALEELARHELELIERRAALTKASQDLEALERLKEKGLDDHNREAARVEQIMLDEIAGNGYWRRAA
jgi:flagellar export protein FliJ